MTTPTACPFKVGDIVEFNPDKADMYYNEVGNKLEIISIEPCEVSINGWMIYYHSEIEDRRRGAYYWRFYPNAESKAEMEKLSKMSPIEKKIHKLWNQSNYAKRMKEHVNTI